MIYGSSQKVNVNTNTTAVNVITIFSCLGIALLYLYSKNTTTILANVLQTESP